MFHVDDMGYPVFCHLSLETWSRDIISVDLACTEHLSSPDVVLELIFRHLLVDFPFFGHSVDSVVSLFDHYAISSLQSRLKLLALSVSAIKVT